MVNIFEYYLAQGGSATVPSDVADWSVIFNQIQFEYHPGAIIYFPAGIYQFSSSLQLLNPFVLKGDGPNISIIEINGQNEGIEGIIVYNNSTIRAANQTINGVKLFPELLLPEGYTTYSPVLDENNPYFVPRDELHIKYQGETKIFKGCYPRANIEGLGLKYRGVEQTPDIGRGHGIVAHRPVTIRNCVIDGFKRNGVHIEASVFSSTLIERIFNGTFPNASAGAPHYYPNPRHPLSTTSYFSYSRDVGFEYDDEQAFIWPRPAFTAGYVGLLDLVGVTSLQDISNLIFEIPEILAPHITINHIIVNPLQGISNGQLISLTNNNGEEITSSLEIIFNPSGLTENEKLNLMGWYPINIRGTFPNSPRLLCSIYIYHPDFNYPVIRSNASLFKIFDTTIQNCGGRGIFTYHHDANAGLVVNLRTINNKRGGIYERSNLGNHYIGGHHQSAFTDVTAPSVFSLGGVNDSVFIGMQTGQHVNQVGNVGQWIGGGKRHQPTEESGQGFIFLKPSRFLVQNSQFISFRNEKEAWAYEQYIGQLFKRHVELQLLPNIGNNSPQPAFLQFLGSVTHKSNPDLPDTYDNWTLSYWNTNLYEFRAVGIADFIPLQFTGNQTQEIGFQSRTRTVEGGEVFLSKDFYVSKNKNEGQTKIKIGAANEPPIHADVAMDSSGNPMYIGNQGDIIFNADPDSSMELPESQQYKRYAGWICISSFVLNETNETASTPAKWEYFGLIDN